MVIMVCSHWPNSIPIQFTKSETEKVALDINGLCLGLKLRLKSVMDPRFSRRRGCQPKRAPIEYFGQYFPKTEYK